MSRRDICIDNYERIFFFIIVLFRLGAYHLICDRKEHMCICKTEYRLGKIIIIKPSLRSGQRDRDLRRLIPGEGTRESREARIFES